MKKTYHHSKHKTLELLLLPRLKVLGWLLIFFGFISFAFALIMAPQEEPTMADTLPEVEDAGPLVLPVPQLKLEILYLGVCTFWIVGAACIVFTWRRGKHLLGSEKK